MVPENQPGNPVEELEPSADDPVFPTDLPEEDGEPLESEWHRLAINLLIEAVSWFYRGRPDFFAGGNMFLYSSAAQVRNKDFRGPDFFFVWGVDRERLRRYWAVWEEDGKYPHVIVELLSPSTACEDRTKKKDIYEQIFRTLEYFLYDPDTRRLEGWRLRNGGDQPGFYQPITVDERGWMWSAQLELYLGTWEGSFQGRQGVWLRFYDKDGNLVRIEGEAERQRADAEKRRADAAESELARLRARLAELEAAPREQGEPGNS